MTNERTNKKNENANDSTKKVEEPKGGRPGPVDKGGSGGMATREVAPELVHNDDDTGD